MRDILVTLIVFGSLPWVLRSPVNGVLMWVWFSVMNPHTQGWGFATGFPFAMVIALTTLFSSAITSEPRALPRSALNLAMLAFTGWMCLTLPFSMYPEPSLVLWLRAMKIMRQHSARRWLRHGLAGAIFLCALAALGTYSRGALLAIGAMAIILGLKSRRKMALGVLLFALAPLLLAYMPPEWTSRMASINEYRIDASAQGRINAWGMAWNLARDRFFGGGFEIYQGPVFAIYAPDPADLHAAHSIYFQVLGEHGFVGLGLYLLVGVLAWRSAAWTIRHAGALDELRWAAALAAMIQASLAGFAVGGAFLSLAYFDVPYYLAAILVATRALVERRLAQPQVAAP